MRNDDSWKIPSLNFSNFINNGMFIKQSPARHADISQFGVALGAVEIEFMHQFESTYYIWVEKEPACGTQERKYSSCGNGASTENINEGSRDGSVKAVSCLAYWLKSLLFGQNT